MAKRAKSSSGYLNGPHAVCFSFLFPFVNPEDSTHPGVGFVFCVYHRVGLDGLPLVYEVEPWNGVIRINMCLFNFNPFYHLDPFRSVFGN